MCVCLDSHLVSFDPIGTRRALENKYLASHLSVHESIWFSLFFFSDLILEKLYFRDQIKNIINYISHLEKRVTDQRKNLNKGAEKHFYPSVSNTEASLKI